MKKTQKNTVQKKPKSKQELSSYQKLRHRIAELEKELEASKRTISKKSADIKALEAGLKQSFSDSCLAAKEFDQMKNECIDYRIKAENAYHLLSQARYVLSRRWFKSSDEKELLKEINNRLANHPINT